ncbi:MAG: ATP-binding protein [Gemmatimonadales bacterium]
MIRIRWNHWGIWLVIFVLTTAGMLAVRSRLDKAHVALLYLLLVLAASVAGGRGLGLILAGVAFLGFNGLFLQPYGTLTIADPLDWLVLVTFLVVGGVATQIVHLLRAETAEARQRTEEVDRLASLGARTLAHPRAADALNALAEMIRGTLSLRECRIRASTADLGAATDEIVPWVVQNRLAAARLADGTVRLAETAEPDSLLGEAVTLWLPLSAGGAVVGVLELAADRPIALDQKRRRFLAALRYYAALGVERVRLEAETANVAALQAADRLKDAVLASVSHDLRTPLTTIKAVAEAMAQDGDERAETISVEADRLNRLVADLLDLSRLRAGGFPLRLELNPVDELVGAVLQRVAGILGDRRLAVSLPPDGPLVVGRFDLGQSIRILVNLIENAHKYSPREAPIDLAVSVDGGDIVMAVMDRGPGVAESERERIFEPFYRPADAPPDGGGAGLGLAIARWLAEAQGGALRYETREGGGSRFALRLPAARLDHLEESL